MKYIAVGNSAGMSLKLQYTVHGKSKGGKKVSSADTSVILTVFQKQVKKKPEIKPFCLPLLLISSKEIFISASSSRKTNYQKTYVVLQWEAQSFRKTSYLEFRFHKGFVYTSKWNKVIPWL